MAQSTPLPAPGERPGADVVIYDGQCRFCTRQVQRLNEWDRRGRLAFLSLDDPEVARRYPKLTREQLLQEMYVVDGAGVQRGGAAAFRYLSRKLPLLWPLAPLMHIPFSLPLWNWAYRQIASRRYQLAGDEACDSGTCEVHFRAK